MNIIEISGTVKKLLTDRPDLRDSDSKLILNVWAKQEPNLNTSDFKYWDFAKLYVSGKLASSESITRARRKMQEEFPNLRGNNYKAKQDHQEDVKKQLREPEMLAGGTP